jgi:hypothetical protein
MYDDDFRLMPFGQINRIEEGIRRIFTEISGIKDVSDLWDHFSPPFLFLFSPHPQILEQNMDQ